jgi:serine beta-lactamase-like protein LACTB, mitochondrial
MKTYLYRIGLLGILWLPLVAAAQDANLPPADVAAVDRVALAEMEKQHAIGLSVGVIKDGKIAYLKAYGLADREMKNPATTQTVFNWASNSKPLAAILAMQLVEAKALDLDADIRTYVPEFPDKGAVITTRQLLCHQSGIPHYSNGQIIPTDTTYPTPQPFLDPINGLNKFNLSPLIFEPGTKTDYSSYAYVLLSAVVQRAGKQSFDEQVAQRIAQPLNMKSLQLDLEFADQPNWATGYIKRNDEIVLAPEDAHYWKHGAGGFKSDIGDFARWAEGLLNRRLVSEASEKAMWTRQTLKTGEPTKFGLGFQVDADGEQVGHGGSQPEAKSQMMLFPREKSGVVVLCNCEFVNPKTIANAIAAALHLGEK